HSCRSRSCVDLPECAVDVFDNDRRLDFGICSDYEDRLLSLRFWKLLQRLPDQLENGSRVLPPAIPDYPRLRVAQVDIAHLLIDLRHGPTLEDRPLVWQTFSHSSSEPLKIKTHSFLQEVQTNTIRCGLR